jgi:hypothetical protein
MNVQNDDMTPAPSKYSVRLPLTNKLNPFNLCTKICIDLLVRCHRPPIWPPALPLNLTHLGRSFESVIREPTLYRILIFHVPNLMDFICYTCKSNRLRMLFHVPNLIDFLYSTCQISWTSYVPRAKSNILRMLFHVSNLIDVPRTKFHGYVPRGKSNRLLMFHVPNLIDMFHVPNLIDMFHVANLIVLIWILQYFVIYFL